MSAQEVYEQGGPFQPEAYWFENGEITILAQSPPGGGPVDLAVVLTPGSKDTSIEYVARCAWSQWLTVPQYQALLQSENQPTYSPTSSAFQVQYDMYGATAVGSEIGDYFTPSAGYSVCSYDTSADCYTTVTYDP